MVSPLLSLFKEIQIIIRYIEDINNRDDEYLDYLKNHIEGVQQTWKDIFVPIFRRTSTKQFDEYSELIQKHDESKYSKDEWDTYLNYFCPDENHPKDEDTFDSAWLHHQHNNPHYWQYWILQRDSGDQVALDMPEKYVIEMLCDWSFFRYKNPESTTNKWYNDNKDKMILSKNTIKLIEKYIDLLKEPLK